MNNDDKAFSGFGLDKKAFCELVLQSCSAPVVYLHPDRVKNKGFARCLMIVEQITPSGVQGLIQIPTKHDGLGVATRYRAEWIEFDFVGLVSLDK
jgi:hypothetical protein